MKLLLPKNPAYRHLIKEQGIEALPGVRDFLNWLNSESVLCVICTQHLRIEFACGFSGLRLREGFTGVVSGDDVINGKPDPEPFLKATDGTVKLLQKGGAGSRG